MIKFIVSQNTEDLLYWFNLGGNSENITKVWLPETERHPVELKHWADTHLKFHNKNENIVVATHSSYLISLVGDYIEDGQTCCLDISVDVISEGRLARVCYFDAEGDFINWPIGFFYSKMEMLTDEQK
ncbi:hypothetical protein NVP1084O_215 [Vibrio phage 1.084.O._10N.261.49.F5]|nr:hypothetical protein NVP1084O_215 [Vibrio phage 1.084.O._10N.261.49.F5]